jgi:hypothetical protein
MTIGNVTAIESAQQIDYEHRPVKIIPEGENVWRVVWADE